MNLLWPILELAVIAIGIYWIRKDAVTRRRSWLLTFEIALVGIAGLLLARDVYALVTGGQVGPSGF